MTTTKTETEINKEKLYKPRPDLLPRAGLAAIFDGEDVQESEPLLVGALLTLSEWRTDPLAIGLALVDLCISTGNSTPFLVLKAGGPMGYGRRKHGDCTWRQAGTEQALVETHVASAFRHILEYLADNDAVEEGSGDPVLYHAVCQLCIALDLHQHPLAQPEEVKPPAKRYVAKARRFDPKGYGDNPKAASEDLYKKLLNVGDLNPGETTELTIKEDR